MKHHTRTKLRIGSILVCITACALLWGATLTEKDLSRGYDSIREAEVYGYVKTMALPRYAGRHTGHEGYTEAAEWAADLFKKWG